ncbi:MAG TPA: putative Ig domain-containing protein [Puia sp.]|nr:putative Ig domain-containing protein [Puia sp.]
MISRLLLTGALFLPMIFCMAQHPDAIRMAEARFATGDDPARKDPSFDDSGWKMVRTGVVWQAQGFRNYHGYAWYRMHVVIPSSLRTAGKWKDSLRIFLAHVNDVDETFLNGKKIGQIGAFPSDAGGYVSKWPAVREYHVAVDDSAIRWDKENIIAVRDYDGGGTGGIFMGNPYLDMLEKTDGLTLGVVADSIQYVPGGKTILPLRVRNQFNTTIKGELTYGRLYLVPGKYGGNKTDEKIFLGPFGEKEISIPMNAGEGADLEYTFTEEGTGLTVSGKFDVPYILTPAPAAAPRINSPKVFGVRPLSPVLFRIAASGEKPIKYEATGLPDGLRLDENTGVLTGEVRIRGEHMVHVNVSNAAGKAEQTLTIKVGDVLSLTPPMGWNSWNCWGTSVSDAKVRSSAQALLDKGLVDHGWSYINIDDGWQSPVRATDSTIVPNDKFPAMKELGDWLHGQGLKFGIYSSPGPLTCGGFTGSWQNEVKDAETYASWGIDYLKYDWCSYDRIAGKDTSLATYIKPYSLMQKALRARGRDIVYSLCQYGMKDVWKWGRQVDGQTWRTTEDIEDTWESMSRIGFRQDGLYPYAGPGHWNDPDMMIVGQVGWGENLHASRLTPDEQYTHVSLWCLLAAPLLIGCDISKLDPFTLNLLTNDEVLAIDQDVSGKQARRVVRGDKYQVWIKEMEDGSRAVGIFNMDTAYREVSVNLPALGFPARVRALDCWTHKWEGVKPGYVIPPHGVKLLRVYKN